MKYKSPWNIAVDFDVDMSFKANEIETMLYEYVDDNIVEMNIEQVAEAIYYYTNGYPFLVSRICQIIAGNIDGTALWTIQGVERAAKLLIDENNTLFEDLTKNIINNKDLGEYIRGILIDGEVRSYNVLNDIVELGNVYGLSLIHI